MSVKAAFAGIVVVLIAGAGVFAIVKSRGAVSSPPESESESTPTVVTVETGALKLATLHRYVQGFGTVETAPATSNAPAATALVSAPLAGVVSKVAVVQGQRVEKGEPLIELNSGTMTVEYATQQLERQKTLYAQQNSSLKNLQDAELQLALLRVASPLSGTVTHLNVTAGQAVDLSTVVVEVTDLDRLAVAAEIPVADATDMKAGDTLEILTESPIANEITYLSPNVNTNNATVLVRALLAANSGLRPGQFVPLRVVTGVHTNCLAAPVESVVTDEDGKSVVAFVNGDQASRTVVKTGLREEGLVEISAPELKAGDTVVTVGAYGLPEKTKILVQNPQSEDTSANPSKAK